MIEVGILYSDLTPVWKPIADKDDFRKDGVLTITITTERGNREAQSPRMWSRQNNDIVATRGSPWWGEDNYAIGVMPDGRFFTYQWADGDELLYARSGVTGLPAGTVERGGIRWPPQASVTIFRGAYLDPPAWARALEIYKTEMF